MLIIFLTFVGVYLFDFQKEIDVQNPINSEFSSFIITIDTKTKISNGKMNTNCGDLFFALKKNTSAPLEHLVESGCGETSTKVIISCSIRPLETISLVMFYGDDSDYEEVWMSNSDEYGYFLSFVDSNSCPSAKNPGIVEFIEMDGMYPIGSSVFGDLNNVDFSHQHTETSMTIKGSSTKENERSVQNAECVDDDHQHSYMIEIEEKVLPPTRNQIVCRSRSIQFYENVLIIFNHSDSFKELPVVQHSEMYKRFPRANRNESGKNEGSEEHCHYINVTTNEGYIDSDCIPEFWPSETVAEFGHEHEIKGYTSSSNHLTPYIDVIFGKLTETTNGTYEKISFENLTVTENMIFMANSIPPFYEQVTAFNDRTPRGSYSYGNLGGSTSHTHVYNLTTTKNDNNLEVNQVPGGACAGKDHTHEVSGTLHGKNLIPTFSVFFVKRGYIPEMKTLEGNDFSSFKISTAGIMGLIACIIVAVIFAFVVLISSLVIIAFVIIRSKKKINETKKSLFIDENLPRDSNQPKLKMNIKMLEINYNDIDIQKAITTGGSGCKIYEGVWKGKKICYKMFTVRNIMENENNFTEFEAELNLMSSLHHPNIIMLYGCTLVFPKIGIVMEFCENSDLHNHILLMREGFRKKIEFEKKLRILGEICDGMIYLHDRNLMHRDLKCRNVLLTKNEVCKLTDFGLSRLFLENTNFTQYRGTSFYMAPEIALGESYNLKVDVFSMSIIMWEILHENLEPYGSQTSLNFNVEMKVAHDQAFRPVIDKEKFSGEKFDWYIKLMKLCWDRNPKIRPNFNGIKTSLEKKKTKIDLKCNKPKRDLPIPPKMSGAKTYHSTRPLQNISEHNKRKSASAIVNKKKTIEQKDTLMGV